LTASQLLSNDSSGTNNAYESKSKMVELVKGTGLGSRTNLRGIHFDVAFGSDLNELGTPGLQKGNVWP